jgi:hypothetical protein
MYGSQDHDFATSPAAGSGWLSGLDPCSMEPQCMVLCSDGLFWCFAPAASHPLVGCADLAAPTLDGCSSSKNAQYMIGAHPSSI